MTVPALPSLPPPAFSTDQQGLTRVSSAATNCSSPTYVPTSPPPFVARPPSTASTINLDSELPTLTRQQRIMAALHRNSQDKVSHITPYEFRAHALPRPLSLTFGNRFGNNQSLLLRSEFGQARPRLRSVFGRHGALFPFSAGSYRRGCPGRLWIFRLRLCCPRLWSIDRAGRQETGLDHKDCLHLGLVVYLSPVSELGFDGTWILTGAATIGGAYTLNSYFVATRGSQTANDLLPGRLTFLMLSLGTGLMCISLPNFVAYNELARGRVAFIPLRHRSVIALGCMSPSLGMLFGGWVTGEHSKWPTAFNAALLTFSIALAVVGVAISWSDEIRRRAMDAERILEEEERRSRESTVVDDDSDKGQVRNKEVGGMVEVV
jgi:hypothetical protein